MNVSIVTVATSIGQTTKNKLSSVQSQARLANKSCLQWKPHNRSMGPLQGQLETRQISEMSLSDYQVWRAVKVLKAAAELCRQMSRSWLAVQAMTTSEPEGCRTCMACILPCNALHSTQYVNNTHITSQDWAAEIGYHPCSNSIDCLKL